MQLFALQTSVFKIMIINEYDNKYRFAVSSSITDSICTGQITGIMAQTFIVNSK